MIHNLKTKPEYFQAVWFGKKSFEIRRNDRNFKEGDFVMLQEWDKFTETPNIFRNWETEEIEQHTGRQITARIEYMTDYEQREGIVVLGIKVLRRDDLNEYKKYTNDPLANYNGTSTIQ